MVEGVGSFNQNTNNAVISSASVYDIHSIMCAIASLAKRKSSMQIDTAKTFKAGSKASYTLLLFIIFLAPTDVAKILSFGKIGFGLMTVNF